MSLKASLEILVHLKNIRNIDLFHQGIYMLKVLIYQERSDVNIENIKDNHFSGKKNLCLTLQHCSTLETEF